MQDGDDWPPEPCGNLAGGEALTVKLDATIDRRSDVAEINVARIAVEGAVTTRRTAEVHRSGLQPAE
jgi:hypothetical protein